MQQKQVRTTSLEDLVCRFAVELAVMDLDPHTFQTGKNWNCFETEYLISTKQRGKEMRGNWFHLHQLTLSGCRFLV